MPTAKPYRIDVPQEKLDAIMGTEGVLLLFAHRKILMQKGEIVVL